MSNKMEATFHNLTRVEAYEKALGCSRLHDPSGCVEHLDAWTDLGCPVAVAAARVEAERVAALRRQIEALAWHDFGDEGDPYDDGIRTGRTMFRDAVLELLPTESTE